MELFREIRRIREMLPHITTPCRCFQSREDEMVSLKSAELLKNLKTAQVWVLEKSSHFYYEESDFCFVLEQFSQWLTREI